MELRNEILEQTNNAGIMTRPVWTFRIRSTATWETGSFCTSNIS
jgi:hypothetical protein